MRRPVHLPELMDAPDAPPADLERSLRFIRRVNRWLGGTRAVLRGLERLSARWPAGQTLSVLDVATGSGDIPEAIGAWARRRGHRVRVLALDAHPTTLSIARRWTHPAPIDFLLGDALALPLADGAVDYATCAMFLHHLDEAQAARAVGELLRVARRGVIISDLVRGPVEYGFIWTATLLSSRMERFDARLSVRKGWKKPEVLAWRRLAGDIRWVYHRHLFGRFTLIGERAAAF